MLRHVFFMQISYVPVQSARPPPATHTKISLCLALPQNPHVSQHFLLPAFLHSFTSQPWLQNEKVSKLFSLLTDGCRVDECEFHASS